MTKTGATKFLDGIERSMPFLVVFDGDSNGGSVKCVPVCSPSSSKLTPRTARY